MTQSTIKTQAVAPLSEVTRAPAVAPRRRRRGYSVVEIGLALIIVAILISAIIVSFYQVQMNARQTQTSNLLNEVYTAIQDVHRSASSYGTNTDLVQLLEAAEMIPAIGRVDPNGTPNSGDEIIVTPFDNQVNVTGRGQTFEIEIVDFTSANCVDMMSNFADRTSDQSGLVGASFDGTTFTFPVSVADITSGCNSANRVGNLVLEYR